MKDLKVSKELIEEVMKDKGTFETININKKRIVYIWSFMSSYF